VGVGWWGCVVRGWGAGESACGEGNWGVFPARGLAGWRVLTGPGLRVAWHRRGQWTLRPALDFVRTYRGAAEGG